jgi:hypothetical protein
MTFKQFFSRPAYLFLLSVFFVFHGFTREFFLVPVKDAVWLLLLCISVSVALLFLFWLLFRDIGKAAFLAFLIVLFNLFYGYIHDQLSKIIPGSFLLKYSVLLPIVFVLLIILAVILKRRRSLPVKVAVYLNILFFIFIIIDAGILISKLVSPSIGQPLSLDCSGKEMPDVFLIVPDEYAGNKNLVDICEFDNSGFSDSLTKRGFFVASNSRSNYDYTVFSMASLLNMDYLKAKQGEIRQDNPALALREILSNKVTASFSKSGYDIYNYSAFDIRDQPAKKNNSFIPARTGLFTSQTLYSRLKKEAWIRLAMNLNIKPVLKEYTYELKNFNEFVYNRTLEAAHLKDTKPKFVYTHLAIPHFPYYFDEKGKPYTYEQIMKDFPGNEENYIRYIKYANTILLKLVDEILQHSRKPPVILLLSDHGYRCFPDGADAYTFMNFFSVYLPGKNYAAFTDSITSVNVFRTLFNTEFCQHLPLLKDSTIAVR